MLRSCSGPTKLDRSDVYDLYDTSTAADLESHRIVAAFQLSDVYDLSDIHVTGNV